MWNSFIQMVRNDEQEVLFKDCFNRCLHSFETIYNFEEMTSGSFWQIDYRYYESSMAVLYERYCYAMSMIVDQFYEQYEELYGLKKTQYEGAMFLANINGCADTMFEKRTDILNFRDRTKFYHEENYTYDGYDDFWNEHWKEKDQILNVRELFVANERKWEFGFCSNDDDYDEVLQTCNKDFLHIQKIIGLAGELDVEKFLNKTKREYLPMIIDSFREEPKTDIFKKRKKWWQFWK